MTGLADYTVTGAEVAAALGLDEKQLRRKWRALERDHAFPRPLPGSAWRWSRPALEAWMRASGRVRSEPVAANDLVTARAHDRAAVVAQQNAALNARYGGRV